MAGYGYGNPAPVGIDIAGDLQAKRDAANAAARDLLASDIPLMDGMDRGRAMVTLEQLGGHMDTGLRNRLAKLLAGSEGQSMRNKADQLERQAAKLRKQADQTDERYDDLRSA